MKFLHIILSLAIATISSCATQNISYKYPDNQDYARQKRAGNFFSSRDLVILDGKKASDKIENSPLWKASIEIISSIVPVAFSDPNSGIIASNWHEDKNHRTKINILVKDTEISPKNLRISIFYQKKDADNNWENDSKQEPQSLETQTIRDKILQKAREF